MPRPAPEIVIGLVGAVGTPLDAVTSSIDRSLSRVAYQATTIRLSALLHSVSCCDALIDSSTETQRLLTSMEAGSVLREKLQRGDALAGLAVTQIQVERERNQPCTFSQRAYILRQLKHHDEVELLRAVYRDQFVLIGVYMPRAVRVERLAEKLAASEGSGSDSFRAEAERLIAIDESERGRPLGQDVRSTFPLADVFVNAADVSRMDADIDRFIDIFFGRPCMTPTRAEVGMFHAQAAALRSAALGRQVGAALMTEEGDLLAVGMNDVPKFGGGHYWTGDAQDGRDFRRGYDQNDELKNVVLREIVAKLKDANLLATVPTSEDGDKLLAQVRGALTGTRVLNLTEFGRDVHAEMSVLTSAGRHGIRTNGCFLYTTTFPCHNCAKHIVAAGISRLIYIEPYAKSLARQFHPDSIDVEAHTVQPNRVRFEPFVGISPRRYTDWFRAGTRKTSDGKVVIWRPTEEPPVFARRSFGGVELAYVEREKAISREMLRRMTTAKLLEAEGAK